MEEADCLLPPTCHGEGETYTLTATEGAANSHFRADLELDDEEEAGPSQSRTTQVFCIQKFAFGGVKITLDRIPRDKMVLTKLLNKEEG